MHRPRGVDALAAHDVLGAADQHLVIEHQQLGVEQRRQLAGRALCDAGANVLELLFGFCPRALERLYFAVDAIRRDREAHHFRALGEDHGAAHGHAG